MTSTTGVVSIRRTGDGWTVSASAYAFEVVPHDDGEIEIRQGHKTARASLDSVEAEELRAALDTGDITTALKVYQTAMAQLKGLPESDDTSTADDVDGR